MSALKNRPFTDGGQTMKVNAIPGQAVLIVP